MQLSHGSLVISGEIESLRKNQGQAFDLKIVGDRDAYIAALNRHPYDTDLSPDGRVRVTSKANEQTDGTFFFKLAHETGVQLRQMREVKHSLEDVFADAMEWNMSVYGYRIEGQMSV